MFGHNYRTCLQLIVVLIVVLLAQVGSASLLIKKPIDRFSNKYDVHFKKASKRYFSVGLDYRWFKAQSFAESNLNPTAVSPVGAKGIMQIMDPTYAEIHRKTGITGNVFNARWNIMAGIYYNSYLYGQWRSPRPELDRLALMFASYNAGLGNILKAQKLCKTDCNLWNSIKVSGPDVRSWKEDETIHYVHKILKLMGHEGY